MQSTIKHDDGNWVLEDGRDGKESTNGTWYYLNQEQAIQEANGNLQEAGAGANAAGGGLGLAVANDNANMQ